MRIRVQALSFVVWSVACAPAGTVRPESAATGDHHCRAIEPNGPDLTGTALRRIPAPGCQAVEGIQLRVVNLAAGVTLADGQVLRDVTVVGGALRSGNRPAEELVGATLTGLTEVDAVALVKIDQVVPAVMGTSASEASRATAPVLAYRLSYRWRDQPSESWQPVCPKGQAAVAVAGQWDLRAGVAGGGAKRSSAATEVTFSCVGAAVGKCVTLLGYRPWVSAALDQLHQSCVRAVRADYCGNGESMTQPNEQVNFYDSLSIQRDGADWPLEAQWSPDGAVCAAATRLTLAPPDPRTRRPATAVSDYLTRACPALPRTCPPASPKTATATLWTEANPPKS